MELGGGWSRWTLESGRVSEGFQDIRTAAGMQPGGFRVEAGRW
jgi:hypothetical protein